MHMKFLNIYGLYEEQIFSIKNTLLFIVLNLVCISQKIYSDKIFFFLKNKKNTDLHSAI